ncbi:MAG: SpoVT / AbrB like domain protein [Candidatus Methanoperedens nitroreducens]|uniref:SpoVT / AbrB like domain protein n=1 Tax=Candidatus Methanoperedens nitratireducens TaxID=1392998 RepID=A0A0P8CL46_9EURY|nr:AbrB/MazE/SpoVT family DNA-binding domain-containing protein [Candidatus Methanoperedens sp. BLZ2]KAB2943420.1 MAG: AbrB/MazE/SpoVT family DNA-binding domain-containing protein [Candidatus Methanoperedens sp.]KPQ43886.1 MAG: SpoVT / AbrB like domain protein [Candidatus Methanoperedens sp. BLZ1]MBZ0176441.1 AbrB/MazE/SpoVT family DNA-binding domain-containing protein [Candidatus Methanoperedens nitroreducens]CAG0960288.1 hypothetical protein METP2_00741 [Methanosarcinales archaeon]MCX9086668
MEAIMKVGPKGQVVIPQEIRHALNIYPGSKVLFRLVGNKLEIEKPPQDAVAIFRESAKGMGKLKIHPHEAYEEELGKRGYVDFDNTRI